MSKIVHLNGELLPLSEARVSVLDRGFLFGDGIYEVVPVYRGALFHWSRHRARLHDNLEKIRLDFDVGALEEPIRQLLAAQEDGEQALYIQITRGVAEKRQQAPPPSVQPTVFMMSNPRPPIPAEKLNNGVACITMDDFRWRRCDIKSVSLLASVMAADHAAGNDAEEVILLRDGVLTEGSSSNYIIIRDKRIYAPLANHHILGGITYQVILELAKEKNYQIVIGDIRREELLAADEIWLTSSLREMLPVVRLDGAEVGDGRPGAVFQDIHQAWRAHIGAIAGG